MQTQKALDSIVLESSWIAMVGLSSMATYRPTTQASTLQATCSVPRALLVSGSSRQAYSSVNCIWLGRVISKTQLGVLQANALVRHLEGRSITVKGTWGAIKSSGSHLCSHFSPIVRALIECGDAQDLDLMDTIRARSSRIHSSILSLSGPSRRCPTLVRSKLWLT